MPIIEARKSRRLKVIPGFPPECCGCPRAVPFAPRCDYCQELCRQQMPPLDEVAPSHWCACHFPVAKAELDLAGELVIEETH